MAAGLRRLAGAVEEEGRKMPTYVDIRENEVLVPMYERAVQEGRQEGDVAVRRRLIEKRFGTIPGWAENA